MSGTHEQRQSRWSWLPRLIIPALLVILAIVFIIQNGIATAQSTINLLWVTITLPIWLLTLLIFLGGGITGYLLARGRSSRRNRSNTGR